MSEEHRSREEKIDEEVVPDFNFAEEIPAAVGRAGAAALPDDGDDAEEWEEPEPTSEQRDVGERGDNG